MHTDQAKPHRRGLKKGQPNPGAFRKGDDPRRAGGLKIYDGMTFAQHCRQLGPNVHRFWQQLLEDDSAPLTIRLRASELIAERGFGKAVSVIDMNVNRRDIRSLTDDELTRIAAGEQPRIPLLIEHETVLEAVPEGV